MTKINGPKWELLIFDIEYLLEYRGAPGNEQLASKQIATRNIHEAMHHAIDQIRTPWPSPCGDLIIKKVLGVTEIRSVAVIIVADPSDALHAPENTCRCNECLNSIKRRIEGED